MNLPHSIRRAMRHMHPLKNFVSQSRLALFAFTLIVFGLALGGLESVVEPGVADFSDVIELPLPARQMISGHPDLVPNEELNEDAPAPEDWTEVSVRDGQSLDSIFRQQGYDLGLLHQILKLDENTARLTRIRPGEIFEFQHDDDGALSRMRYALDESQWLVVERLPEGLNAHTQQRQLSTMMFEAKGVIDSSLFLAGKKAGLSDAMVMKLANIFGWDIDFVLDIRGGDRFYMLYEKIYRDGEYLRDGEVLAATFVNQGEKFQAVRYEADNGPQYYAPDGRHMRKAFLRAPLNFSYISSNFNPKRFHPILRRIKAHNGIDYRAPQGTPVYAAGDGRVIRSGYDQYNGHHVFLQHANNIVTKYLHFTNRTVKNGERVRQGQVIGYVGATGLAEAPHLHYEFVVNGAHRNPRTVSLPTVKPLESQYLASFRQHAAPYLNQLGRLESASMYASRE